MSLQMSFGQTTFATYTPASSIKKLSSTEDYMALVNSLVDEEQKLENPSAINWGKFIEEYLSNRQTVINPKAISKITSKIKDAFADKLEALQKLICQPSTSIGKEALFLLYKQFLTTAILYQTIKAQIEISEDAPLKMNSEYTEALITIPALQAILDELHLIENNQFTNQSIALIQFVTNISLKSFYAFAPRSRSDFRKHLMAVHAVCASPSTTSRYDAIEYKEVERSTLGLLNAIAEQRKKIFDENAVISGTSFLVYPTLSQSTISIGPSFPDQTVAYTQIVKHQILNLLLESKLLPSPTDHSEPIALISHNSPTQNSLVKLTSAWKTWQQKNGLQVAFAPVRLVDLEQKRKQEEEKAAQLKQKQEEEQKKKQEAEEKAAKLKKEEEEKAVQLKKQQEEEKAAAQKKKEEDEKAAKLKKEEEEKAAKLKKQQEEEQKKKDDDAAKAVAEKKPAELKRQLKETEEKAAKLREQLQATEKKDEKKANTSSSLNSSSSSSSTTSTPVSTPTAKTEKDAKKPEVKKDDTKKDEKKKDVKQDMTLSSPADHKRNLSTGGSTGSQPKVAEVKKEEKKKEGKNITPAKTTVSGSSSSSSLSTGIPSSSSTAQMLSSMPSSATTRSQDDTDTAPHVTTMEADELNAIASSSASRVRTGSMVSVKELQQALQKKLPGGKDKKVQVLRVVTTSDHTDGLPTANEKKKKKEEKKQTTAVNPS